MTIYIVEHGKDVNDDDDGDDVGVKLHVSIL